MAQQTSSLPPSNQLQELVDHLVKAKTLFGSPKAYARMALEEPRVALEAASAAEALGPALRSIRSLV